MAVRNEEARRKALRLREEECLGLDEIASRVGVAKSTCYSWIRHRPLTEEGRRLRRTRTASASVRPRKDRGERSVLHIMAEPHDYSPLETGAIAESATVLRLVLHRWKVLNSAFDGDVVDLYATRASASRLLKIQVRTARTTGGHGLPIVSLRRMHHGRAIGFSPGDFDILVGYSLYNDTAYVWTYEEIADLRCSVTVCDAAAEAWGKLDAAFERMGAGA